MFLKLAFNSLIDRKGAVSLSVVAMAISIAILLGVEHIRQEVKQNFSSTVSGVDLIVGARTSNVNLLLYSVFRIGAPTNNISWKSFKNFAADPRVDWAVPISLGDSHKGHGVVGTVSNYFEHFSYGKNKHLAFYKGAVFTDAFEVVLGFEVASREGYGIGDTIVLAHGMSEASFALHDKYPFTVVGVLEPTATPVDRTVYISLAGMEAIHSDWPNKSTSATDSPPNQENLGQVKVEQITAFMLRLKNRLSTFKFQNEVKNYRGEPLTAILPGVALSELWGFTALLENSFFLVSIFVFTSACVGMSAMLFSSIRDRAREMKLLRIVGASPSVLFFLIELEALLIALVAIFLGLGFVFILIFFFQDYLLIEYGISVGKNILSESVGKMLFAILMTSFLSALVPSFYVYRKNISLQQTQ